MNRREFIRNATGFSGALMAPSIAASMGPHTVAAPTARVAFVKTMDRSAGVVRAIDLLAIGRFDGRDLFVKPNFNSADKAPGSTHEDTLTALLKTLKVMGAGPLTIGDRSGMGNTRDVMERKRVFGIAKQFDAKVVVLDELRADAWELIKSPDSHWQHGFALPRMVRNAGGIVQTCCLKTHRYGGHFTLSLKNSVGLSAKSIPGKAHDFMRELHSSPHQRQMIAEINAAYRPELIVLDGVEAFVSGGPDHGQLVNAGIVLAATERVAADAVGVALLRHFGTTPEVSARRHLRAGTDRARGTVGTRGHRTRSDRAGDWRSGECCVCEEDQSSSGWCAGSLSRRQPSATGSTSMFCHRGVDSSGPRVTDTRLWG